MFYSPSNVNDCDKLYSNQDNVKNQSSRCYLCEVDIYHIYVDMFV